jgi:HEPN superfamily AbiU2-like protein
MPEYAVEFRQSWTFWFLTLGAHLDAVLHRLCKAYDQYGSGNPTVNLRNLLDTRG